MAITDNSGLAALDQNQTRGLVWDPVSGSYQYANVAAAAEGPLGAFGGKAYTPGVTFTSTLGNALKQYKAGENPYGIQSEQELANWIYNTARAGGISSEDVEYELGLQPGTAKDYFGKYGLSDYQAQYTTPSALSEQDKKDINSLLTTSYGGKTAEERLSNPYLINELRQNYDLSNEEIASFLKTSPENVSKFLQPAQDLVSAIKSSKTYEVPQGYTGPAWLKAYNPGGTLGDTAAAKANQLALAKAFYESYGRDPNPSEMDRLVSSSQTTEGLNKTIASLKGGKASDIQALYDELRNYNPAVVRDKTLSPDEIMNLGLGNIEDIGAGRQNYIDAIKALKSTDPNAYYQSKARLNPTEYLNKVNKNYGGAEVVGSVGNIPMFFDHRGKLFIGDEQISGSADQLLHAVRKYGLTSSELSKFNDLYMEVAGDLPSWARPDFGSVLAGKYKDSGPEAVAADRSASEFPGFSGIPASNFSSASRSYAETRSLMDQLGLKPKGYAEGGILGLDAASTTVANPNVINSVAQTNAAPTISPEVAAAYQTLFGRAPDEAGGLNWTQSGLTGQALLNAMVSGAQGADIQAFENYQKSQIEQGYQNLFGRAPEEQGLNYWLTGTNLIGDDLTNALKAGARGADIGALYKTGDTDISTEISAQEIKDYMTQNVNDPYAIYSAAEKYKVNPETISALMGYSPEDSTGFTDKYNLAKTVATEYGDIGRGLSGLNAIDKEGFNYWYNQLLSGAITPQDFEKAFLTGAMDVVKAGYDPTVSSKTIAESIAKGYGGAELLDKTNPLDFYEALGREGQTVESLSQLYPNLNSQQVNDYLAKVPELYGQGVDQTIKDILGESYLTNVSAEEKQAIIDNLVTGSTTRQEVYDMFANSEANKKQEAERLAGAYMSMYGGSKDDALALYSKLLGLEYNGPGSVSNDVLSKARSIFDVSLQDQNAGLEELVKNAANREGAENTEFFKTNPAALYVYGDLKTRSDDPYTQYGTLNGAPIYDANAVDKYLAQVSGDPNLNSASNFAHRSSDRLGIEVGGQLDGGSAFIKRGADVFGLSLVPEMSNNSFIPTPTGRYTVEGDINAAAQQVGIDPSQFKDTYRTETGIDPETGQQYEYQVLDKTAAEQIYEAINSKVQNLYLIGSQNPDNPNEKSADNFMYTMYQRTEDGKLIPINNPTYYEGVVNPDVFKKKGVFGGGFLGDMMQGLAGIPLLPEIIGAITMNPYAYAAAKGAQTGAYSNSFADVGKSAGLAYLSAAVLPELGGDFSKYLADSGITNSVVNQALTQGVIGGGVSTLAGGSGTEGLTSGLISGGIGGTLDTIKPEFTDFAKEIGVPSQYAGVFANTLASLAPTLLTGGKIDPTKVLMSYLMKKAMSGTKPGTQQTAVTP